MRRWNMPGLMTVAFLVTGCNQPSVTLKAPTSQSAENTVRDWSDIAHRISQEMSSQGLLPTAASLTGSAPPRAVFVRVQAPDSTFLQEVADALANDVLKNGGIVAVSPAGATVVNLDVDFVRWGPRNKPSGPVGTLVAAAAISGTVIGASMPMATWTAAGAAAFSAAGLGIATDVITAMAPMTNTEAVWKATILSDDRIVMKLQEPVYIREKDIPLYAKATSLAPVASWSQADRPLAIRPVRYAQ